MRRAPCLVVTALLLPLSGCCSLARLFCGPDKSAWVQVDYRTPELALRTLLEAIRRDEPEILYQSLANECRERMHLSSDVMQLAWQQVKAQTPGIHLAGYAEIPAPIRMADGGATFVLDVEGRKLTVDLVRESVWEIGYLRPKGTQGEGTRGRYSQRVTSWNSRLHLEPIDDPDRDRSRIVFEPFEFEHEGLDSVPLEAIDHIELVRQWKVAALNMVAATPSSDGD